MKVVIADAQDIFRSLLRFWINSESGIQLVADTNDGLDVVRLVSENKANLLIMDPILPKMSGFSIAREISERMPDVRMIAAYHSRKPFLVDKLQRSGFHACICKRTNVIANLKLAMESVMDGNAYYCAETCRIQNALYNNASSFVRLLSSREQEVLCLIGAGMDNDEIGCRFKLSPATVQTHRRNLFRKLGIHDTPSLMRYALEQGFWNPGQNEDGSEA